MNYPPTLATAKTLLEQQHDALAVQTAAGGRTACPVCSSCYCSIQVSFGPSRSNTTRLRTSRPMMPHS
jgi:hypothetical protein